MNVLVLLIVFTVSQWHCICTDGLDINFVSVGFKVVDTYKGKGYIFFLRYVILRKPTPPTASWPVTKIRPPLPTPPVLRKLI
eukprot:Pgem_evm1s13470